MSWRSRVSGAILVGVCFFGAACEGSGSDDDSSAGSGGQAAMPSSGGSAGTGSGGASGGTGGSAGTGNSNLPNIDPNKLIDDLTDQEKAELCDWMAGLYGGYGARNPCPAGSVQFYASQEICVTAGLSFTCPTVTVGDVEACELAKEPSGGCDTSDPSCEALCG